jgi:transposase
MEKYSFFVGIDISKAHLDYCIRNSNGRLDFQRLPNTAAGIKEAVKWMRSFEGFRIKESLVCLEQTGIYGLTAAQGLQAKGFDVWQEVAACIKNGSGTLNRGKSDKVDAGRIADYAFNFRANSRLWEPPRKELVLLKDLMASRERLKAVVAKLAVPVNEIKAFKARGIYEAVRAASSKTLAAAKKDLKAVEMDIMKVINGDPGLKGLYRIVTSVRGVGFVTATALIIATNEFKDINNPRKLACHAGCAPFEHSSGSSVRGRNKVSHRADKHLKSLLHLCALSAIQVPGEFADYYERRVKDGKNKFVIINAIRNKIIHRVCACVRDNREYTKFPQQAP